MEIVILTGNTNTRIFLVSGNSIKALGTIRTRDMRKELKRYLVYRHKNLYFASVVPEASKIIRSFFKDSYEVTWKDFPGKIYCKKPEAVGIDRLLNAAGAWSMVKSQCMIIDAGSAITIDFVDNKGNFEGGVIFPGKNLIVDSLQKLALLKKVKIPEKVRIIGKDTSEAIGSGIVFGLSFFVSGYIDFFSKQNPYLRIFFTGGDGRELQRRLKKGSFVKNLGILGVKAILYGNT
ncbi:MAG: type III pantothenate kinase [Candidatus Omnitrophica bacterium]|nr:type III pantothenate kinase [Candidatus Omnitrophota bacterium]